MRNISPATNPTFFLLAPSPHRGPTLRRPAPCRRPWKSPPPTLSNPMQREHQHGHEEEAERDQSNRCASKRSAAPVPVSSRRLGIALPNGVAPLPVERGASTRGSLGIGRSPVAVRPVVTPAAAHPAAPEEKPHRAERDQQPEPVCLEKFHGPALRQHLGRFASAPRHLLQPAPRPSFVVRIRSPAQPTSSAGDRTKARCRPRWSQA